LIPFLISAGLGIPGVGVAPLGNCETFAGMPGVAFADSGTGLAESPGGRLFGSRLTVAVLFEFDAAFVFAGVPEPQPKPDATSRKHIVVIRNLDI
jgi:hypothetical protein